MISRDRVRATLNQQEPDRVPMMMSASGWVIKRLKQRLGVETDRDLHRALHLDVFDTRGFDYKGAIGPKYIGPEEIGIPSDWRGDLFKVFGYHEEII